MAMSLDSILNSLNQLGEDNVKTAGAAVAPTVAGVPSAPPQSEKTAKTHADLLAVLKQAEAELQGTKTASASTQVGDLTKIAADLAAADHEALTKEAQFYGAAVADGFMIRIKQYEAASEGLQKVASDGQGVDVEKIASEAVRGFVETRATMEKEAADAYNQGYQETIAQIEKVAHVVYEQGAEDLYNILAAQAR